MAKTRKIWGQTRRAWEKFWGKAMLKGGGLGIYGELLTNAVEKPYGGVLSTLAGPFGDDLTQVSGIVSSAAGLASAPDKSAQLDKIAKA